MKGWKSPALLLATTGIANIGDFIYLIAINIIIYEMTGSATAVAGLWIITPIVNIVTKAWTGSFIDYRSKRKVMMATYGLRAAFIALIPFAPNVAIIYIILVFLSIAQSFFVPSSMTYIAMLVPPEKRKRFNAIRSFSSSGAFIVGPAIGGLLILATSISITLIVNALFFIVAAILLIMLPDKENQKGDQIPRLTFTQVTKDFTVVTSFLRKHAYIAFIYIGYLVIMLFSFAMDTQEVVFTQRVIGLSEVDYSLLVSVTGGGSIVGAVLLFLFANRIPLQHMIGVGVVLTAIGYVIYAFSWSFLSIAIGFIILGFFQVFLNAGMMTFYQNHIPVEIMGRVTSILQLFQSFFQIIFILGMGIVADLLSLRYTIVALAAVMLICSIFFIGSIFLKRNRSYFKDAGQEHG